VPGSNDIIARSRHQSSAHTGVLMMKRRSGFMRLRLLFSRVQVKAITRRLGRKGAQMSQF
jgi:hypothetical protein